MIGSFPGLLKCLDCQRFGWDSLTNFSDRQDDLPLCSRTLLSPMTNPLFERNIIGESHHILRQCVVLHKENTATLSVSLQDEKVQ
jgi:hypothetical protein